ncbi:biotin/lipoate A/B protein ligase family protein [Candidatus Omnitrophota bacterium]
MQLVEFSTNIPEKQIALDELLLRKAEAGEMGEALHFWEAKEYYIVVGRACRIEEDCFEESCARDNMKILRRISGGGTVLQGPGCLNYSAILSYENDEGYGSVGTSYKVILKRISDALEEKDFNVEFRTVSDLALDGRKISGNAQARKKKYFLHHGTFLYDFDLDKIPRYLKHPSREPEYREARLHKDFLKNIPMRKEELEDVIKKAFSCGKDIWIPSNEELKNLKLLVKEKYESSNWNRAL